MNRLSTYRSVAVHGGVASEDPHKLVLMLMDGALQRIVAARGCLERGDLAQKAQLLQRAMSIVAELRASLNLQQGGQLAHNLDDLYDYMSRQLLRGNVENRASALDEVHSLLGEVRNAWEAVPLALHGATGRPVR